MPFAICQFDATDEAGDLLTNVQVTVRNATTGALAALWADREGTAGRSNPFWASDGKVAFYCAGGAYNIGLVSGVYSRTLPYRAIGRAAETDLQLATPQGAWSASTTYSQGDYVRHSGKLYSSLQDGNLNNTPDVTPGDTAWWMYLGAPADGADGATVQEVLDELGIHGITVSTSDPSGPAEENDLWLKVPF